MGGASFDEIRGASFLRLWILILISFFITDASAHRFAPSLLEIWQISDQEFSASWKTPIQKVSSTKVEPHFPEGCIVHSVSPWVREGTGSRIQLQVRCIQGLLGETLSVRGLEVNRASALLRLHLQNDIFYQTVFTTESPSFTVPIEPAPVTVAIDYSWLGAEHILAGPDHLLFVAGLLLLVGRNRKLLYTITSFTVGHSLTLAVVTLGALSYPVALVEFLIALSIFLLALELARGDVRGAIWGRPWWLAGLFGLLHGMGFAGALIDTGLPQDNVPLALFYFNLGVELGQLFFVGCLFLTATAGKELFNYQLYYWRSIIVYSLGGFSAMWCIERGIEVLS